MSVSTRRPLRRRLPPVVEEALAATAMAVICVISLANVLVRYATDVSFAFTEEISVFMLVFMALFGSAVAFARDEHIRIDFFQQRLPRILRWCTTIVSLVAALIVFGLIIRYGATFTYEEWYWGSTSPGLGWPNWIYSIWLPIGAVVITLRIIERFLRQIRQRAPD